MQGVWWSGYSKPKRSKYLFVGFLLRRYELGKEKLWNELIDFKYMSGSGNIFQAKTVGVSPF